MIFNETSIPGLMRIQPFSYEDFRGSFVKTFHAEEFKSHGLDAEFKESFYSGSIKGTIRGMHFQLPPEDHVKLVFCISGEILDVIVDIRRDSPTYLKYESFLLNDVNRDMLYIPKGCAHGFCALSEMATVFYFATTVHSKTHDSGIRYDSFGFEWPADVPVLSSRDLTFPTLEEFVSPF